MNNAKFNAGISNWSGQLGQSNKELISEARSRMFSMKIWPREAQILKKQISVHHRRNQSCSGDFKKVTEMSL